MKVVVPTPQVVEMKQVEGPRQTEETFEEEDPHQTRATRATTKAKAMTTEVHHRSAVPAR